MACETFGDYCNGEHCGICPDAEGCILVTNYEPEFDYEREESEDD